MSTLFQVLNKESPCFQEVHILVGNNIIEFLVMINEVNRVTG